MTFTPAILSRATVNYTPWLGFAHYVLEASSHAGHALPHLEKKPMRKSSIKFTQNDLSKTWKMLSSTKYLCLNPFSAQLWHQVPVRTDPKMDFWLEAAARGDNVTTDGSCCSHAAGTSDLGVLLTVLLGNCRDSPQLGGLCCVSCQEAPQLTLVFPF